MSKFSGIWWRESKQAWYTTLHGKQIRLSSDEEEAREKFALFTRADLPGDTSRADEVCDEFLEHVKNNKTQKTFRTYTHFLKSFC